MSTDLINGFGNVYLRITYDAANRWVCNEWIGYQTYIGILAGADACLQPLQENHCAYLLNDNRRVIGPWDHAVEWVVSNWAPRAIAQGLTHFANVVSPEALAASSAQSMAIGLHGQLQMHMFDNVEAAQEWLREAQQQSKKRSIG
ncbi:STAS/SEC14 domain-containing protein [Hymenobacter setariae]|uniref:STAS/SEC14 domain-containing protein n=1 Tax=Hymenobacter setariae TaxID=2594794 RepID=A0A558C456_9BACT|nr:STAS/SEC14 domain-containing protein [Hymenobacter setariae]TVT43591.1 STAS/SEC14 domain-containing protein [Hymenobacter setariae]